MADTLIDEPPPPTLRDPEVPPPAPGLPAPGLPAPGPPAKAPPGRASIGRRLAIAAAVLAAILAVAGVAVYLFFIHYEAVARRHVPGNANLVVRMEAADVVLFGPVRKHLWPLAIERATRSGKTRGNRIREATGINLATDVREVIVASTDATSWVLLAGGRLARGKFVGGLAKIAEEEGWSLRREGDLLVGTGLVMAQAEDGTIVVGTDKTIVNASLPRLRRRPPPRSAGGRRRHVRGHQAGLGRGGRDRDAGARERAPPRGARVRAHEARTVTRAVDDDRARCRRDRGRSGARAGRGRRRAAAPDPAAARRGRREGRARRP
ncbi:MAG: hypothetical protein QM820_28895 [Minicystis sp.]